MAVINSKEELLTTSVSLITQSILILHLITMEMKGTEVQTLSVPGSKSYMFFRLVVHEEVSVLSTMSLCHYYRLLSWLQFRLFGAEYETGSGPNSLGPFGNSHQDHNVPCAVCATTARGMQLMIPARVNCPDDSWTREYSGYLMTMSDKLAHFHRTKFICVDREAEVIPDTAANGDGTLLYHVRVESCSNERLPCPGYNPQKEIACVVCSK